jgi:hypothetical protein
MEDRFESSRDCHMRDNGLGQCGIVYIRDRHEYTLVVQGEEGIEGDGDG